MNIDEYRAYKAQLEQQQQEQSNQTGEEPPEQPSVVEQAPETPPTNDTPSIEEPSPSEEITPQTPEKIVINGEEVTLEQINEWKNGYLRQSDYTRKAQELARQKKEMEDALRIIEHLRENPELAQQVATQTQVQTVDPAYQKLYEIEARMYDMMIEREVESLTHKYPDFEVREVLTVAQEKNMTNLEDAYLLWKARQQTQAKSQETAVVPTQTTLNASVVDIETIKEQLRQELLNELKAQQTPEIPTSIISTQGATPPATEPPVQLTPSELKVARAMGMSAEEYAQWRNKK